MISHASKRRRLNPTEADHAENSPSESSLRTASSNFTDIDQKTASQSFDLSKSALRRTEDQGSNINRSTELARASGLSKSSLFKLQTDELLSGLKPDYPTLISQLRDILDSIKDAIYRIPDRTSKLPLEAGIEMRDEYGITVPFPTSHPTEDSNYFVSFLSPVNVNIVGSTSLRTGLRGTETFNIDLAVTMPGLLFQEKDYLNHRFFHKRAYYIASIAVGIQQEHLPLKMNFGFQDGDSLRPIIILEPGDDVSRELTSPGPRIRIITAVDDSIFPISKTLPMKNNILSPTLNERSERSGGGPTPFYNGSLRSEGTVTPYHKYLHSTIQKYGCMRDACILGRTWLRQRGLGTAVHDGGFGGFEWTVLLALLFESGGPNGKPILLPSFSSSQVFKATIQFLSRRDLMQPLVLFTSGVSFPTDGPVLYDGKRGLNILYKMTSWSYDLLRHESSLTLSFLNEPHFDNFDKVFIHQIIEPVLRFDRVICLAPPQPIPGILHLLQFEHAVYRILATALGDRSRLIYLSCQDAQVWSPASDVSSQNHEKKIIIGLLLKPENADRLMDHGPPAEQKDEAASFRTFWGEKAELRRFKDGSILESLMWSDPDSASSVVYQIIAYALQRHLGISEESIKCIGDEYDEKVRHFCGSMTLSSSPFQLIQSAFQSLQRSLQNIDDVPLSIRQLQPASALLRFTALPARPGENIIGEPVEVILQLESSARWPDDIVAIQLIKVALLTKIGDLLKLDGSIDASRVGLENNYSRLLNRVFLDVTHISQVVFRLRIHHDREQALLERKLKEKNLNSRLKEEVAAALSEYKQSFIQAPRLTQAIRALSTRLPLLSPTIRLMKHWFHSHLLLSTVKDELIELLTTHTFVNSCSWDTPSSVMSGFFGTLLTLSKWDWQREPLIVDFGSLTTQELSMIKTRFLAWRNIDPAMSKVALVVASEFDQDGVTWTLNETPPKVVAARISNLAKAAVNLLKQKGTDTPIDNLFKSSLAPFDFIIHLNQKHTEYNRHRDSLKFKNIGNAALDFEPVNATTSFLHELQMSFSHCILFFYGGHQRNIMGGLWRPQLTIKSWSLKMAYSTCPAVGHLSENSTSVALNKASILNEIAKLGGEIVESIEVHGN